ncbi:MAG: hypothetical protein PHO15_00320 [Eubacteriales bacterium]|nr:hypothetical protein [Eubacteriales bacterium]
MEIIIEHGRTKRRISGAFNICGNAEDLRKISSKINDALAKRDMVYGWIQILDKQESIPNQEPELWETKKEI